jgi:hypothetical protein
MAPFSSFVELLEFQETLSYLLGKVDFFGFELVGPGVDGQCRFVLLFREVHISQASERLEVIVNAIESGFECLSSCKLFLCLEIQLAKPDVDIRIVWVEFDASQETPNCFFELLFQLINLTELEEDLIAFVVDFERRAKALFGELESSKAQVQLSSQD